MLITADARQIPLATNSVQCVVTSPPYWGLRDYGSVGQIGLEETPDAYVAALVDVFREVKRVLRDDGTLWVNLGDSYAYGGGIHEGRADNQRNVGAGAHVYGHRGSRGGSSKQPHTGADIGPQQQPNRMPQVGLKSKDMVGIPWRVAFALQSDGWYLRSDIIWHKPNPMPEAVRDRPTKSHEYLFLLTKSATYFYDQSAIAEPVVLGASHPRGTGVNPKAKNEQSGDRRKDGFNERWRVKQNASFSAAVSGLVETRNARTVWTIPTQPYAGAHFATMPEALIEPCIHAGCPLGGLVLDPFIGSGTVGAVAERLGRRWVGCDLSYHDLATKRTSQRGLRFETGVGA